MLPLCAAEGIGVIPWSPQARGKLTRDWNYTSIRTETDEAFGRLFARTRRCRPQGRRPSGAGGGRARHSPRPGSTRLAIG